MEKLTGRQQAILEFISSFLGRKRIPPTVREIQKHFGFESPNAVTDHLELLEGKGYLRRHRGQARGIELVSKSISLHPDIVNVPLIGQIAAGSPTLAEENIDGYLHLDKTLIRGDGHFLLKVRGDSMKEAGIYSKDFVLVKKQERAESGEIIAAYLGGEATVKYFWTKGGRIELRPANPSYSPIPVAQEKYPDFRILGKVRAVIRVL